MQARGPFSLVPHLSTAVHAPNGLCPLLPLRVLVPARRRCLNRPKGAGMWMTLRVARALFPLQWDHWLQLHSDWLLQHEGQLDGWVVFAVDGTVLRREQWEQLESCPEAYFGRQYQALHALYRQQNPLEACRCERCGSTLAAAGERMLAMLHLCMMTQLATAGGQSVVLRQGAWVPCLPARKMSLVK